MPYFTAPFLYIVIIIERNAERLRRCGCCNSLAIRGGAVCQWHTLSADRSGAETAVCQWHTLGADRTVSAEGSRISFRIVFNFCKGTVKMTEFLDQYPALLEQLALLGQIWLMFKIVFGALNCFMGYKLLRVWTSLCGFVLGAAGGFLAALYFSLEGWGMGLLVLGAGIVAGAVAYQIYLVGAFILGWLLTVFITLSQVRPMDIPDRQKLMILAGGAVLGMIVGALIVGFARPVIIVVTGIGGASAVASSLGELFAWESLPVLGITVVLAVAGIAAQFLTAPQVKKGEDEE